VGAEGAPPLCGAAVGVAFGAAVGEAIGAAVGEALGAAVGEALGEAVGEAFGAAAGEAFGAAAGEAFGAAVGEALGDAVGEAPGGVLLPPAVAAKISGRLCGNGRGVMLPASRKELWVSGLDTVIRAPARPPGDVTPCP